MNFDQNNTRFAALFLASLYPATVVAEEAPPPVEATTQAATLDGAPPAAEPSAATPEAPVEIMSEEVREEEEFYGEAYPVIERALNLMNGRTLRPGTWEIIVAHRTSTPVTDKPGYNYLGFDGGNVKIGLGARYGVIDNLDVGLYRMNGTVEPFDTYEFDARYQLLHREQHYVDLAVRAGFSWFLREPRGNESFLDAQSVGFLGQVLASTVLFDRLTLGGGWLFHSDSTNNMKTRADDKPSMALMALTEFRILGALAYDLEVAGTIWGYGDPIMTFSTGPKLITNRHTFSFVLSNTQYFTADGIVTNTRRNSGRWVIGFNITREL